jgi:uncharacterized protein
MELITYRLDERFYERLEEYTARIMDSAEYSLGTILADYMMWIRKNNIETLRSQQEYLVEMIMAGVYWNTYIQNSMRLTAGSRFLFGALYGIRTNSKKLKPFADKIRGYLSTTILAQSSDMLPQINFSNFSKLLDWLDATSEFKQEVIRLRVFERYLRRYNKDDIREILGNLILFANVFEVESKRCLGRYTTGVSRFLESEHSNYKYREDNIFSGRAEVEYHLNMVAACVMNHSLLADFNRTSKKVVLLPTCMRTNQNCKAITKDGNLVCTKCSRNCNIYKIVTSPELENTEVYLISHSSSFSKILGQWENKPEYGLVGVACVLNLITGGYEMKNLGIASQCVLLDGCGCQKHWHKDGMATDINRTRLINIIELKPQYSKAV